MELTVSGLPAQSDRHNPHADSFRHWWTYATLPALMFAGLGSIAGLWWIMSTNEDSHRPLFFLGTLLSVAVFGVMMRSGKWWALAVSLSPTVLLMSVFPLVVDRLGVDMTLVLTVSVAVPWISQAVTWPMYRPLEHVSRLDVAGFAREFATLWPALFLHTIPPVAALTAVLAALSGWNTQEILICMTALLSNVLFTQSLLPASDTRRHLVVITGWAAYALCLFSFPQFWYLAPLAGVLPQLVLIISSLDGVPRPRSVALVPTLKGIIVGGLLGSLVWGDKILLILLHLESTSVATVYIALIPVVIAQGVYFASQQEMISEGLNTLYARIKEDPLNRVEDITNNLSRQITSMFARLAVLAVLSSLAVLCLAPAFPVVLDPLSLLLFLAPPVFFLLNLHVFQFIQFQTTWGILLVCLSHVVVTIAAFTFLNAFQSYVVLIAADLILILIAHLHLRHSLHISPYRMFWRKASQW